MESYVPYWVTTIYDMLSKSTFESNNVISHDNLATVKSYAKWWKRENYYRFYISLIGHSPYVKWELFYNLVTSIQCRWQEVLSYNLYLFVRKGKKKLQRHCYVFYNIKINAQKERICPMNAQMDVFVVWPFTFTRVFQNFMHRIFFRK